MATVLKKSFGWGMLNFVTMKHFFIELSTFTMYIVQAEKLTMASGCFDMMKNDLYGRKSYICHKDQYLLQKQHNLDHMAKF